MKVWLGGWNPVCSSSGRVEGGTDTQGSHDSSGVDEWKASSVLPCPLQGELEGSGGRVSGLLSVLPMHKAWGYGIKCLFLPEILGRAWPFLSSEFSPPYHLCRELFLLTQSTVTAPLKYDLRSLDLIQFHLQRFFFFFLNITARLDFCLYALKTCFPPREQSPRRSCSLLLCSTWPGSNSKMICWKNQRINAHEIMRIKFARGRIRETENGDRTWEE